MKTVLPRVTPPLRQAWIPTDSGSIRAPSSNVTLSGNLKKARVMIRKDGGKKHMCTHYARESVGRQRPNSYCVTPGLMLGNSWQTFKKIYFTCSRSWHCACSICTGSHCRGVWHRRRWMEISYIVHF